MTVTNIQNDKDRIRARIEYLLSHESEQTWDERYGHSGEYEEWTSLMSLIRELRTIDNMDKLRAIAHHVGLKLDELP